jgi:phenylacetate-CoA ligase
MELIPTGNAGQCKVVSTGFWNTAMPFIRYELEDIVIPSKENCCCGRAFPVIESISGRQADVIRTLSGREFGAALLTHLLYGTDHILESQIVQDRVDHIYIDYVPGQLFNEQDFNAFNCLVKQHLPSELYVDFRAVEAVQRTSSGKLRPVVSLLS